MKALAIYGLVLNLIFFALLILIPTVAQGSINELMQLSGPINRAIEAQNWGLLIVLLVLLITACAKRFWAQNDDSKKARLPKISAITGAGIGSIIAATGQVDPMTGVIGGMLMGNAATGLYDAGVKPLKKRLKKRVPKVR
jgi:hypothetical protein